jgi:citrate lyase subunit beta/citryl-CoA lyase
MISTVWKSTGRVTFGLAQRLVATFTPRGREATWASTLGAVGKWAIHMSQIEIANDVFAPTEQEIALARRMCDAYCAAEHGGAGAAGAGGFLVDAAAVRIFEAVLERARLTGRA